MSAAELATRTELLAQLDRLDAEEDAIRAQRAVITYRLEQLLRERGRLQRHLSALDRGASYRRYDVARCIPLRSEQHAHHILGRLQREAA